MHLSEEDYAQWQELKQIASGKHDILVIEERSDISKLRADNKELRWLVNTMRKLVKIGSDENN
jgi:hypothetical protein